MVRCLVSAGERERCCRLGLSPMTLNHEAASYCRCEEGCKKVLGCWLQTESIIYVHAWKQNSGCMYWRGNNYFLAHYVYTHIGCIGVMKNWAARVDWPNRDTGLQYATFKKKHVVRIGVVNWVASPISIGSLGLKGCNK